MAVSYSFLPFSDSFDLDVDLRISLGYLPISLSLFFLLMNISVLVVDQIDKVKVFINRSRSRRA